MSKIKKIESSLVNLDFMHLDVLGLAKQLLSKVAEAYGNKDTSYGDMTDSGQFGGRTSLSGGCHGKGVSSGIGGKGRRGGGGFSR